MLKLLVVPFKFIYSHRANRSYIEGNLAVKTELTSSCSFHSINLMKLNMIAETDAGTLEVVFLFFYFTFSAMMGGK